MLIFPFSETWHKPSQDSQQDTWGKKTKKKTSYLNLSLETIGTQIYNYLLKKKVWCHLSNGSFCQFVM
jgi:hypothetical protein